MKIVFIQPKSFHCWEALNVGYLISYLENKIDADMSFFSGFFDSDKEIIESAKDSDMVAVSATSPQFSHGLALVREIKRINPKIVAIFGGVHASALPEDVLGNICVDAVVVGEGEKAFLRLVKECTSGKTVKGVYKEDYIKDLDILPFPDRFIIKQERNIQQAYKDNSLRIASIFSSRGCPFKCRFCASDSVWGKKVRHRSAGSIYEEYDKVAKDLKIDFMKFSDDTFTLDKELVAEFCEIKNKNNNKTEWGCNVRADDIDEDLLVLMKSAGCKEVWIGVESGSPEILKTMKKGITLDNIRRVFKITKKIGFSRRAYMLLGMPDEAIEDIRLSEQLIDEIEPDTVGFTILAPYPGSSFYDYSVHKDIDWSGVDEYENRITKTKFLTNRDLHNEQKRLVNKYHSKAVFRQKKNYV